MARYLIIGIIVFLVLAVGLAPAGIVSRALEAVPEADLLETRGTIWQGQGQLLVDGRSIGALSWSFKPLSLFALSPAADWQLSQNLAQLSGTGSFDGLMNLTAAGQIQAPAVNQWLAQYDIELDGLFDVENLSIVASEAYVNEIDGVVRWTGGMVRFTLSGRLSQENLPPLLATFTIEDGIARGVVTEPGSATPLLIITQAEPGLVKIGLTKGFTRVLNQPWPGSDPDHVVVLEVEEYLR